MAFEEKLAMANPGARTDELNKSKSDDEEEAMKIVPDGGNQQCCAAKTDAYSFEKDDSSEEDTR